MAMQETNETSRGVGEGGFPSGRRPEFRIWDGTPIRDGELKIDAPRALELYKSPHAIQHLANVTPDSKVREVFDYYRDKSARLFVANLKDERIVGAFTVAKETGLKSAKASRLVVSEDQQGRDIAHRLIRRAASYAFSPEEAGGLDVSSLLVGVILDVPGSDRVIRIFEKAGFQPHGGRIERRCYSWDLDRRELVIRDVIQMMAHKNAYVMRHGSDLAKPPQPGIIK